MKKFTLLAGALILVSATVSAQVGVNTSTPKTTMDVSAKRDSGGNITDNTQILGLQAPRLTRAELTANTATYAADQRGALIYITDISGGNTSGQRVNINAVGYYFFNGSLWQKVVSDNIYNANGLLTNARTLDTNGFNLTFTGTKMKTYWDSDGTLMQQGLASSPSKYANMILFAPDNNSNGINSRLDFQIYPESYAQIIAGDDATGLALSTNQTTNSAPITFSTSLGSNALATEKMRITGEGNVGINTTSPTEKLDVNGNTRLRTLPLNGTANSIYTQSGGGASATQNQTFTATRTVVADANGVLGYVTGLPQTAGSGSGTINIGETVSRVYSLPAATANTSTFNLKTYVTTNSLQALPQLDGLEMNLQGVNSTYYDPRVYNIATGTQLVSYQTFATQVNENETSLNNSLTSGSFVQVDANNIVFWTNSNAEVITTNLQVQVDATTYRWYEFKWWCMEVGTEKKIFLSVTRKG